MTDATAPKKAKPPLVPVLVFQPTAEEREMVERMAVEEDRALSTVVRRIFRAGVAAQGLASGNSTHTTHTTAD